MAYTYDRFVWCELVTPNTDDGIGFWSEVAGFRVTEMKMPDGSDYRTLVRGEQTVAGVIAPRMPGVAPHFTQYVSVSDVAEAARRAAAAGGRVIVPATDVGIGTFALVADPQGATFQLWHSAQGDGTGALAVSWNELWASDAEAVAPFYASVFGWARERMEMPSGPYHVYKREDASVAGLMTRPDAKIPPMWLPYLEVDDVDAVVQRARSNGGAVHAEPMSVEGVGRFAIIADRQGAVAGVIASASR